MRRIYNMHEPTNTDRYFTHPLSSCSTKTRTGSRGAISNPTVMLGVINNQEKIVMSQPVDPKKHPFCSSAIRSRWMWTKLTAAHEGRMSCFASSHARARPSCFASCSLLGELGHEMRQRSGTILHVSSWMWEEMVKGHP